jgi:hypothetical protein
MAKATRLKMPLKHPELAEYSQSYEAELLGQTWAL